MPDAKPSRRRHPDVTETALIGGVEKRRLEIVDYDPSWPDRFVRESTRITAALEGSASAVEHIGSTSVPGLPAKPIVDILVTVPDITDEDAYVAPLLAAGYEMRVREPGHRMVRTPERDVHVHVLEPDDPAGSDYLLLRDHLRQDPADRELYAQTKRELARHEWSDMNAYADAKTDVIEQIKARARADRE